MVSGQDLIDGVSASLDGEADTLYCNQNHHNKLSDEMTRGIYSNSVDNLELFGLDVVVIDELPVPIICKKGTIFPLAKEYKNQ